MSPWSLLLVLNYDMELTAWRSPSRNKFDVKGLYIYIYIDVQHYTDHHLFLADIWNTEGSQKIKALSWPCLCFLNCWWSHMVSKLSGGNTMTCYFLVLSRSCLFLSRGILMNACAHMHDACIYLCTSFVGFHLELFQLVHVLIVPEISLNIFKYTHQYRVGECDSFKLAWVLHGFRWV